ncbi:hypothetical protein Ae201684P_007700 [Aphanomyces euteiches]|uniref:RxLR effector protein n=1 Tax=Aphanomyces euteiches TaxID=100861 RepID=A0A6G0W4D6_9STRA|nr:hypothetical protein Ae201684_018810 [Aphanomyces euteiches]KAH9051912.1 hypothetical protein Ae201684P_017392 [Aphanomyces euteiches]KAH9089531.1 hypothetical protein Ae201684P_007700 [Aphanomyces euteiches]
MRLFLVLIFALSALAAGSRSSLQKRRLASFSHGGDESSQVATSRVLLQAAPKMKGRSVPIGISHVPPQTRRGKLTYLQFNFSPATHKSLGMFQPKKKDRDKDKDLDSRAFKGVKTRKSRFAPQTSNRRLQEMPRSPLD